MHKGVLMHPNQKPRATTRAARPSTTRSGTARRTAAVAAGALTLAITLAACGPSISSGAPEDTEAASADRLQAPTEESPQGEITIWDRSGDLFNVFEAVIDDF